MSRKRTQRRKANSKHVQLFNPIRPNTLHQTPALPEKVIMEVNGTTSLVFGLEAEGR